MRSRRFYFNTAKCCAALFVIGTVCAAAAAPASDEEAADGNPEAVAPGYDVEPGARDPFFPADRQPAPPVRIEKESPGEGISQRAREAVKEAITLTGVIGGRGNRADVALVNGGAYRAGDTIGVTAQGRHYRPVLKTIAFDPVRIVLRLEKQDITIRLE